MAILRKTEKAMCGVEMIEKRRNQELMSLLALKDTLDGLARASGVRWYGHVLKRNIGDVLRRAFDFEVAGRRGRGRPNMRWKKQVNSDGLRKNKLSFAQKGGRWFIHFSHDQCSL